MADSLPMVVLASRNGPAEWLEELLDDGHDPNEEDGYGGTCLVAAACYAQPECVRLLIDHGADVDYAYPGDNASILYMLALCFSRRSLQEEGGTFSEGDYVLAADLLIQSGAPTDTVCTESVRTAIQWLREMEAAPETKEYKEKEGLLSLLKHEYWLGEYNQKNPFLDIKSPEEGLWLIQKGAANNGKDDQVDRARLRSIRPELRPWVLGTIQNHKEKDQRSFFLLLLAATKTKQKDHRLSVFHGLEHSVLANIARFLGVTGKALSNAQQAAALLENI